MNNDTELNLINWRGGNAQAERLGAKILIIDGYESVDPQCPLGGPDGLKDIVCEKNGWKYIAASYFGINQKAFKDIKVKFIHDLEGVEKNKANGIVFITNQHVTPSERQQLEKLAEDENCSAMIFHKERLVSILDSPMGYGIRLDLFGIEMTKAEQTSFFSQQNNYLKKLLDKQSEYLLSEIFSRIDGVKKPIQRIEQITGHNLERTLNIEEYLLKDKEASDKSKIPFPKGMESTENLTTEKLCSIHKMLLFSDSSKHLGELRTQKVWIGNINASGIENATFVPAEPEEVQMLTESLLEGWRNNYQSIKKKDKEEIIDAITNFHFEFLKIHPFLDGNGRVARFLLNQQTTELLEIDYKVIIDDNESYYLSLNMGHEGDLSALKRILIQAIFGKETI